MISLQQARNLHLAAQGLLQAPTRPAKPTDIAVCIQRMALLQIDTIHVASRSPYLVLHSRLGDYPREWLEEALAFGQIFETWAHEACFAPMDDLHLHRAYNRLTRRQWGQAKADKTHAAQRPHPDKLLKHISIHGPVKSSDFERPEGKGGAGWGVMGEKRWLEARFGRGCAWVCACQSCGTTQRCAGRHVGGRTYDALSPFDPVVWADAQIHEVAHAIRRGWAWIGMVHRRCASASCSLPNSRWRCGVR